MTTVFEHAYASQGNAAYAADDVSIERTEGCRIITADDRELLDLTAGGMTCPLGYGFPAYESAFSRHREKAAEELSTEAAARLLDTLQSPKMEKVLWAPSPGDAADWAIQAALQKDPERRPLLAGRHGYHGTQGFAGHVSGSRTVNPYVYFFSFPANQDRPHSFYQSELEALAQAFPEQIGGIIVEPFLATDGSFTPPEWFLQLLQGYCREHGIVFILDEAQSAPYRTGHLYACQQCNIEPDLLILGRAIANGQPIAALAGSRDLLEPLEQAQGTSHTEDDVAGLAGICATLDVVCADGFKDEVAERARCLDQQLADLVSKLPCLETHRGCGMAYGLRCTSENAAQHCFHKALQGSDGKGVQLASPVAKQYVPVMPMLTMSTEDIGEAIDRLERAWRSIPAGPPGKAGRHFATA